MDTSRSTRPETLQRPCKDRFGKHARAHTWKGAVEVEPPKPPPTRRGSETYPATREVVRWKPSSGNPEQKEAHGTALSHATQPSHHQASLTHSLRGPVEVEPPKPDTQDSQRAAAAVDAKLPHAPRGPTTGHPIKWSAPLIHQVFIQPTD